MSYRTIKQARTKDEFEEKKSLFIGNIKRVESEEEARAFIDEIKKEHKQATHNVYAYVIGKNMGIQRYTDDGEPQGTAGIPVLEVIKKNGITDCVIVVTRYFGGVLLGTGGLTRAYSKGAAISVKKAGIVEKVNGIAIEAVLDYDLLGKVQYVCNENQWYIENTEYTDKVKIILLSPKDLVESIENELIECTNGRIVIEKSEEDIYFKEGNRLFKTL